MEKGVLTDQTVGGGGYVNMWPQSLGRRIRNSGISYLCRGTYPKKACKSALLRQARHVCYSANPICSKIPWFMQGPTKRKAINLKDHAALPETVAGERSGSKMKRIRTSFENN